MSVAVALDELRRKVDEFGPVAFLVTADAGRPHAVSVNVSFDGDVFSLAAGRTSRGNVDATQTATLLWPGGGGPYGLIVDGAAHTEGETAWLRPTRAVLHRLADASTDLPSCVRIEADEPN